MGKINRKYVPFGEKRKAKKAKYVQDVLPDVDPNTPQDFTIKLPNSAKDWRTMVAVPSIDGIRARAADPSYEVRDVKSGEVILANTLAGIETFEMKMERLLSEQDRQGLLETMKLDLPELGNAGEGPKFPGKKWVPLDGDEDLTINEIRAKHGIKPHQPFRVTNGKGEYLTINSQGRVEVDDFALRRVEQARRERNQAWENLNEARAKLASYVRGGKELAQWIREEQALRDWDQAQTKFSLEKNEVSRLHRLIEASLKGAILDGDEAITENYQDKLAWVIEHSNAFVVKHDWAAVLGEHVKDEEFHPPFTHCTFEFRISAKNVVISIGGNESRWEAMCFIELPSGAWLAVNPATDNLKLATFAMQQTMATAAVLEAQVASHEVVRAPHALNIKREKNGKTKLVDFHIVDLTKKRSRVENREEPTIPGAKKRLHFCRGHWRHFQNGKRTRIPWCLKGDPDLGFVDKLYKL